ncbi:UDP-N-acetylglucosamine transferase subunit ALG14 homolog [Diaphorina citri]|jgi:UDP-N-acetylglucosamine:LPS N-acetylglucosamine transferase|uniref:UDP-N-acetylglucosamine transferase subunit ALG14 n=1 Tax=Diaphorina citri TaxID=121845 RepID=A0A1S3D6G2_DIACI|nr:UDP-N-acetylglucosamine transferase subunit ALG14 homolog [Diaphorina citri]
MINWIINVSLFFVLCILVRAICLLIQLKQEAHSLNQTATHTNKLKTLIILGSGGHSTEMLRLVKTLNPEIFKPKMYILASSDSKSKEKLLEMENHLGRQTRYETYDIPRSRKVHQSYITSIFTTLFSFIYCVPLMLKIRPDIILCNGPGTCIPICLIAFVMRVLFISNCVLVFVESTCRVKTLSLSGIILYYFADIFLVHWEELSKKYNRAKYIGRF